MVIAKIDLLYWSLAHLMDKHCEAVCLSLQHPDNGIYRVRVNLWAERIREVQRQILDLEQRNSES